MIVLTDDEKAKDYYVTRVDLNGDRTYTVSYASGKKETYPFSVHNFNVDVSHMEREYYQYKDDYLDRLASLSIDLAKEKFRNTVLTLLVGIITYDIVNKPILKILAILLCILFYLYNNRKNKEKIILCGLELQMLYQIESYIKNKENLKITVMDPTLKYEHDWYLYNLSDVEYSINDPSIYERKAASLTPEIKQKLAQLINKE